MIRLDSVGGTFVLEVVLDVPQGRGQEELLGFILWLGVGHLSFIKLIYIIA